MFLYLWKYLSKDINRKYDMFVYTYFKTSKIAKRIKKTKIFLLQVLKFVVFNITENNKNERNKVIFRTIHGSITLHKQYL